MIRMAFRYAYQWEYHGPLPHHYLACKCAASPQARAIVYGRRENKNCRTVFVSQNVPGPQINWAYLLERNVRCAPNSQGIPIASIGFQVSAWVPHGNQSCYIFAKLDFR